MRRPGPQYGTGAARAACPCRCQLRRPRTAPPPHVSTRPLHKRHGARRGGSMRQRREVSGCSWRRVLSRQKGARATRPQLSPGRLAHTYAATSSSSSACSMAFSGGSSTPSAKATSDSIVSSLFSSTLITHDLSCRTGTRRRTWLTRGAFRFPCWSRVRCCHASRGSRVCVGSP